MDALVLVAIAGVLTIAGVSIYLSVIASELTNKLTVAVGKKDGQSAINIRALDPLDPNASSIASFGDLTYVVSGSCIAIFSESLSMSSLGYRMEAIRKWCGDDASRSVNGGAAIKKIGENILISTGTGCVAVYEVKLRNLTVIEEWCGQ